MINSKKEKLEFFDYEINKSIIPRATSFSPHSSILMNEQKKKSFKNKISPFRCKKKSIQNFLLLDSIKNNQTLNSENEDDKVNHSRTLENQKIFYRSDSTTTTNVTSSESSISIFFENNHLNNYNDISLNKTETFEHQLYKLNNKCFTNLDQNIKPVDYKEQIDKKVNEENKNFPGLVLDWFHLTCEISVEKSWFNKMFDLFNLNENSNKFKYEINDKTSKEIIFANKENLNYVKKKLKKTVLYNQSGQFVSGTINAIIGASGAGKSTFLECLSGRRKNNVKGEICLRVNNEIFDRNVSLAYLGQNETLINVLTVKETLLFASRLKNYNKIKSYKQHLKLVDSMISEFKLENCANTYIHSVSGGQLKRVAIAAELISGPDIIMLDEPTSGLDSCTAYNCIKLLRKITGLAYHQQYYRAPIVICSIHQPSIQLLNEFHNIYVISNTGKCIYQGAPEKIIQYLSKFNLKCPKYCDPINYFTEIASGYDGFEIINKLALAEELNYSKRKQIFENKFHINKNIYCCDLNNLNLSSNANKEKINEDLICPYINNKIPNNQHTKKLIYKKCIDIVPYRNLKMNDIVHEMKNQNFPFFYHTFLLIKRTYLGTIREPKLTWLRIFQALFIGFLMSFLYDHPIGESGGCLNEGFNKYNLNSIKSEKQTSIKNKYVNNNHFQNISRNEKLIFSNLNDQTKNFINLNLTPKQFLSKINLNQNTSNELTNQKKIYQKTEDKKFKRNIDSDNFFDNEKVKQHLNSKANTHDNVAFVFFVTLFLVMSSMMPTVLTFPTEVRVLYQERNNGYYACISYYMAKIIADTPFIIFNSILFCCIVYPLTGQLLEWKIFFMFTFIANVAALIAHCIGMLFGTIYVHSITSAVFMAPLSMSPVFLFSGFFGKISSLPFFLKPIAYVSYVRYCFECFLISIYGFHRCEIINGKTFFLHRNMTEFNFFSFLKKSTQNLLNKNLIPNITAEPLVQIFDNYSLQNTSTKLLNSNLPNYLFKNFSSIINRNLSSLPDQIINKSINNLNNTSFLPQTVSNIFFETINSSRSNLDSNFDFAQNNSFLPLNSINEINKLKNSTTSMVLDFYNIDDDIFWQNIILLGLIFLFLRISAYWILVIKTNNYK